MELVVLFAVLALLIFGPRKGGRTPSPIAMILGAVLLGWLILSFGLGAVWNSVFGTIAQP